MSIEEAQLDSHDPFRERRITIGQIKFDPSDGLRERLTELYIPEKREMGRRALFLSSQYRMVSHRTTGGRLEGIDGQKASRLERAIAHSKKSHNMLGQYMKTATKTSDGHEFIALQFAVHLHPRTIQAIQEDQMLQAEALLKEAEGNAKAILVYEAAHILGGSERTRVINRIGEFVAGSLIHPSSGGDPEQRSLNRQAYVTNVRFTFSDPPRQS